MTLRPFVAHPAIQQAENRSGAGRWLGHRHVAYRVERGHFPLNEAWPTCASAGLMVGLLPGRDAAVESYHRHLHHTTAERERAGDS